MTGAIVVILLLFIIVLLIIRSQRSHGISESEFIARVQSAADGVEDINDYDRLIHTPIVTNPRLESFRGRLVRIDDKFLRKDGDPISAGARAEIAALVDEMRAMIGR